MLVTHFFYLYPFETSFNPLVLQYGAAVAVFQSLHLSCAKLTVTIVGYIVIDQRSELAHFEFD